MTLQARRDIGLKHHSYLRVVRHNNDIGTASWARRVGRKRLDLAAQPGQHPADHRPPERRHSGLPCCCAPGPMPLEKRRVIYDTEHIIDGLGPRPPTGAVFSSAAVLAATPDPAAATTRRYSLATAGDTSVAANPWGPFAI